MNGYLLDNNIINYWHNKALPQHALVVSRLAALPKDSPLRMSVIVLGEIEDGMNRIQNPTTEQQEKQDALRQFIRSKFPEPLEITRHVSPWYGQLRSLVFRHCYPSGKGPKPPKAPECWLEPATSTELGIQENDLWMVAQAAERGLVFVTHDRMKPIRAVINGIVTMRDWSDPNDPFP